MSNGPKDPRQIAEQNRQRRESIALHTYEIVSPDGDITEHYIPPPDGDGENGPRSGDTPAAWINGRPEITKRYRERGYQMMRDVCISTLGQEKGRAMLEERGKMIRARMAGNPIRGDISSITPPAIFEMRSRRSAGGNQHGMAYVVGEGIVPDPEVKKARVAEAMSDFGIGDPRTSAPPTPKTKPGKAAPESDAGA